MVSMTHPAEGRDVPRVFTAHTYHPSQGPQAGPQQPTLQRVKTMLLSPPHPHPSLLTRPQTHL